MLSGGRQIWAIHTGVDDAGGGAQDGSGGSVADGLVNAPIVACRCCRCDRARGRFSYMI